MRRNAFILFSVFVLVAQACADTFDPRAKLEALKNQIEAVFDILAQEADTASNRFSEGDIREDEARSVLSDLCGALAYSVDCAYVNEKGVMRYIEPEAYRIYEGKDISGQPQFAKAKTSGHAVFSRVFRAVEGFDALDYESPVADEAGHKKGTVSVLMKPADFIRLALGPEIKDAAYEVMVLQADGLILFSEEEKAGRNVFTDTMYQDFPSFLELCRRVVRDADGEGVYVFKAGQYQAPREKRAAWTTVEVGENVWRLLVIAE